MDNISKKIIIEGNNHLENLRKDGYFITNELHQKNLKYVSDIINYLNKKFSENFKLNITSSEKEERLLQKLFLFIIYNPDLHIKELIYQQIKLLNAIRGIFPDKTPYINFENWLNIFNEMYLKLNILKK